MNKGEYLASLNDDIFQRISCVYYSDCNYCEQFDDDTGVCGVSVDFVIDTTNWTACPDFRCTIPFECCSGDCDR